MTDCYTPPLDGFALTADEEAAVEAALATNDPWKHDAAALAAHTVVLAALKNRIREFHLQRRNQLCCYCHKNLHGEFNMVLDREHILPKSTYPALAYRIGNLATSCKKCNMRIKGNDVSFVIDLHDIVVHYADPRRYSFIHPNFDRFQDHMDRIELQNGGNILVAFCVVGGSDKGKYHYDYFHLCELAINSFDDAQGRSFDLTEVVLQVTELAKGRGQVK
ncbi:HNH endonuclease [Vannielia sp. SX4]|uniref:HNH endonuclease n=1 Tax=Vannielia sp. SX4 TaxID=3463852 RepID=UPI0040585647